MPIIIGPTLADKILDHLPLEKQDAKSIRTLVSEIPGERRQEINRACTALYKFGRIDYRVERVHDGRQFRYINFWWRIKCD